MQEGIKAAKTELNVTPVIAGGAIDTLKTELGKLVEAIQKAVLGKVDAIVDARNKKIARLAEKISDVKNNAGTKSERVRFGGDDKVAKATNEINKKIVEVEAQLKGDLADLKDRIANLESETKSAKTELGTLTKIKTLFA